MPTSRSNFSPQGVRVAALLLLVLPLASLAAVKAHTSLDNPHGRFKEPCGLCHSSQAWKPARISPKFDHAKFGFPLTGAHAAANCLSCHTSLEFAKAEKQCATCHEDPHRGEFGTECARCHGARSFVDRAPMVRAHQMTRFPLSGAHASLDCAECHQGAEQGHASFVGAQAECMNCHRKDYVAADNPDHEAGHFADNCLVCHNSSSWRPAKFDHDRSGFPLTGAHKSVDCASCHQGGVYAGTPKDCVSCHRNDFNATTSPNHVTSGMSTACITCHNTTTWGSGSFDHNTTRFPLTGAHRSVDCASCHRNGVYAGTATDCVSCHRGDFDGTTDPRHAAAGFSLQCQTCHTTGSWSGATFNHATTGFSLTGAHAAAACNDCHANGVFAGTSSTCESCHRSDYDGTTNPKHSTAGFSTQCQTCHTTSTWSGATFDHDASFFPINSGTHRGRWDACSDCHTNAQNYAVFTCLSCHPHSDKAETDGHHNGRSGYSYTSAACYSCHPRGRS